MKVWEMSESLRVILSWAEGYKNSESLGEQRWSEEEKRQLHDLVSRLATLTEPEEGV